MEITHAKTVLAAILAGCDDENIIKELIDTAWKLIRDEGDHEQSPPPNRKNKPKKIVVNDRPFKSVTAACRFYGMEKQYTTVLNDLEKGVHPGDIFPTEPPTPKTRMNIDPRNGLVLPH